MARKFMTPLDLNQLEIRNAVIQNLGADPGSPVNGQFWYLTTGGHDIKARVNGSSVSLLPSSLLALNNTWTGTNAFNGAITGNNTINLTGTGASSVGGTMGATAFVPSGLSGATSASRYVGATTSGAPASGTFAVGDYVVARDGHIWVCTSAGSPGTWTDVAGSGFPGYGAVTAQTAFGAASSNGAATTVSRSDHTHGTPTHDNAAHSAINLSALAAPTVDVSWGSHKITSLLDPTNPQDAATKAYVDGVASGLDPKASVRAATTAAIGGATYNATGGTSGRGQFTTMPNTIDGVSLAAGNRVLVKDQATGAQNGIYVVSTLGTGANGIWDRATDFDQDAEVTSGAYTFVEEGTTNADSGWVLTTNNPITIGGSSGTTLAFAQFSGAGQITAGNGLTKTGNTLDVGAGTGISVAADTVGIDTAVVARKVTQLIGNGSLTSIAVTHNLGNQHVIAQVVDASTNAQVDVDVVNTDANNTTFTFAVAPASNAYRAIIVG